MDFIKKNVNSLIDLGFGSAVPGLRDSVKNLVNNVTTSDSDQKAKIQSMIDADRAQQQKITDLATQKSMEAEQKRPQGRMRRQAAVVDAGGYKGYEKGGKVSSASKRADGCAIRGKTRA